MNNERIFNRSKPVGTMYYKDGHKEPICIDSIEEIGGLNNILFHTNDFDYFYEEYLTNACPDEYVPIRYESVKSRYSYAMKSERWLRKPRKEPIDWDEVFDIDRIDVKIKWVIV